MGGSQDLRSRNWAVLRNGNQSVRADDESPEGAITLSPKIVPDQNSLLQLNRRLLTVTGSTQTNPKADRRQRKGTARS